MSARTVIEHALRVYYADSRDPQHVVERLLAQYDAERAISPLYVADYDSAPLTLHLTREAARAACDDVAEVDAHGRYWDWRTEDGDVDRQFWAHPDDDSPIGYTGGAVWQISVEPSEKDTRGGSPQQGESTHEQRHPRPCEFPTVLPCQCPRPSALPESSFIRARYRARIGAFSAGVKNGHGDAHLWVGELR
ncbi:hypothetical protein OHA98_41790 [Streptomyces sp. NBC_00654]|uniref:hypothetical protein n=1 Tax=Streptomyces sp. NBC_00654 TaxID=2975799 RepID=UPI002250EA55|nr:hypothetical protein [Streptomyces sp. NBC_00654]MCX4969361.1 hypothetical protein [Streptomyces sp. NBC_00654]MCX4971140.1 hypothetical protein [Streptomyces sp. NBC_00654]